MRAITNIINEGLTRARRNNITFLTGAGVSSASGIPTYRGADGIWVKGTKFYKPESFGTFKHFSNNADEVWQYTFFRKKMFAEAKPNEAHFSLVSIEKELKERFHLITQNIDNLHQRAGSKNMYEIHGNLREMRCSDECSKEVYDIPREIPLKDHEEDLTYDEKALLVCPRCGEVTRPNILWFDEYYNERNFKVDTTLRIAKNTSLLMILGSSGATNLPNALVRQTLQYGGSVIDVNLEDNAFTEHFKDKKQYYSYRGSVAEFLDLFEKQIKINETI
ncbi:Sir2 family NAD-dependent protein deacetylase [uncultured Psychroserpens sp.]|uniref:SIR2 family NAD-dependent protein deacylase n=1 Tax=uncultured Psychroserpens sp. TaxID=255436 RepID=UPI00261D72C2|nr:Sir2 family NAD-dependent protein deacetylase [uncultured Psychroserpens sp.]